eukprot:8319908-Pyramimonas_sp.AAC.1
MGGGCSCGMGGRLVLDHARNLLQNYQALAAAETLSPGPRQDGQEDRGGFTCALSLGGVPRTIHRCEGDVGISILG